jgi:GNAT superfamily N-acetyltransferase
MDGRRGGGGRARPRDRQELVEIVELAPGDERLRAVYPVMKELRTHLSEQELGERYAAGHGDGYRLVAVFDGDECRAAAGYRLFTNFVSGRHLYVDDLVTAERWRSRGYGRLLNKYLVELARNEGCSSVQLDSAVHRTDAHRFYFRERYAISSFHFLRVLS